MEAAGGTWDSAGSVREEYRAGITHPVYAYNGQYRRVSVRRSVPVPHGLLVLFCSTPRICCVTVRKMGERGEAKTHYPLPCSVNHITISRPDNPSRFLAHVSMTPQCQRNRWHGVLGSFSFHLSDGAQVCFAVALRCGAIFCGP